MSNHVRAKSSSSRHAATRSDWSSEENLNTALPCFSAKASASDALMGSAVVDKPEVLVEEADQAVDARGMGAREVQERHNENHLGPDLVGGVEGTPMFLASFLAGYQHFAVAVSVQGRG